MERLLQINFFKSNGFLTKRDGMLFVKSIKAIENKLHSLDKELTEFQEIKIEEFQDVIDDYEMEKKIFQSSAKERENAIKIQKREIQKQSMKEQLKNEILEEIEKEKMENENNELKSEYDEYVPNFKSEIIVDTKMVENKFLQFLKTKPNKTKLAKLKKIKKQIEDSLTLYEQAIAELESLV